MTVRWCVSPSTERMRSTTTVMRCTPSPSPLAAGRTIPFRHVHPVHGQGQNLGQTPCLEGFSARWLRKPCPQTAQLWAFGAHLLPLLATCGAVLQGLGASVCRSCAGIMGGTRECIFFCNSKIIIFSHFLYCSFNLLCSANCLIRLSRALFIASSFFLSNSCLFAISA